MSSYNNLLKKLGLESTQIKIIQSLEAKDLTILDLSKETNIPRTSLYYILPQLSDRGFIKKIRSDKKIKWRKINEEIVIKNYLGYLQDVIPQNINKVSLSENTEIKVLNKNENVLGVFEDILKIPNKNRFWGIQPKESILSALKNNDVNEIIKFNKKVNEKGLIVEGIIHERGTEEMGSILKKNEEDRLLKSFSNRSADTVKLPDDYLKDTNAEIYLYDNKIALVNWKEEFGVIIKNDDVFNLLKTMFNSTKYLLDKYDQNEKIARLLVDKPDN